MAPPACLPKNPNPPSSGLIEAALLKLPIFESQIKGGAGSMTPPAITFLCFDRIFVQKNRSNPYTMSFLPRLPRLRHDTPGWVENPEYFITLTCKSRGLNHLCKPGVAKLILESIRHRQRKLAWRWELVVLMPDHLHGILSIPDSSDLARSIFDWKRWIASQVGIKFQEGFFDHRLRSDASAQEKWNYVNQNPVRAGLVKSPGQWPFRWTTKDLSTQPASSRPPHLNSQPLNPKPKAGRN